MKEAGCKSKISFFKIRSFFFYLGFFSFNHILFRFCFAFLLFFFKLAQEFGIAIEIILLLSKFDLLAAELGQEDFFANCD